MRNKWIFLFFTLLACNSHKDEKGANLATTSTTTRTADSITAKNDSITTVKPTAHNFWDTLTMGIKLSYDQISRYTSIHSAWSMDSFYIDENKKFDSSFGDGLGYWADSTFIAPGGFKVAIIKHFGVNIADQYLVVFDSAVTHNLSYIQVSEGADRDGEDSPYSSLEYKIVSNSTFETIENYDPGDADKKHWYYTETTEKWKINNRGLIDSIRKIVKRTP